MTSAPLFIAFLMLATVLWTAQRYHHTTQDKRKQAKMRMLALELVKDAEMKIKAVQHYRDQYYKSLQYQLGDIVYELRDTFKRMIRVYQANDRNISYGVLEHNKNVMGFVAIHRMAMEIETKVYMIQEWQRRKREKKEEFHERMLSPMLRSGPARGHAEQDDEQLSEAMARARMERAGAAPLARAPSAAPARLSPAKRKNQKWRHVVDEDFV